MRNKKFEGDFQQISVINEINSRISRYFFKDNDVE